MPTESNEIATLNQRTITLVTIPQEVAHVINDLRYDECDTAYISELALRSGGGVPSATLTLQSIPFDTLLSALVNGYTVEKSAEELAHDRIRDQYTQRECVGAFANGIAYTLDTLGIKISEVNA